MGQPRDGRSAHSPFDTPPREHRRDRGWRAHRHLPPRDALKRPPVERGALSASVRVLGEDDGDNRFDGELEDAFRLAVRRFIDIDPEPDALFLSRSAYERLLDSARILRTASERTSSGDEIERREIEDAHRLSGPALRFLLGR